MSVKADRRTAAVVAVRERLAEGRSQNRACSAAGVSAASFGRWAARLDAGGTAALEDLPRSGRPRKGRGAE